MKSCLMFSELYSISSEESAPQGQESRASMASSKPTLSDIYERSEEGDSERKKSSKTGTTKTGKNSMSSSTGKNKTTTKAKQ